MSGSIRINNLREKGESLNSFLLFFSSNFSSNIYFVFKKSLWGDFPPLNY